MFLCPSKDRSFSTCCTTKTRFRPIVPGTAVALVFLVVTSGQFAFTQDIVGRISGTVTDMQGATISGASVTISSDATGFSRALKTNGSGFYVADSLPVGKYTVTIVSTGFKRASVAGNELTAGGRLTIDVAMEVGTIAQVVEVTSIANTVNTISGEISTTISSREVESLPLNQRHYESVVSLIPGASLQSSGLSAASITSGYNNSIADINGQRLDGQNWSVDGGWNLDAGSNNSVFNEVGVDFIQEVAVQSSNYDAEFGRSASATINAVTKSGGKRYHGGGFEFVQNNIFNAANTGTKLTFVPSTQVPTLTGYNAVPPFHLNDFGWDLGGPIPYMQKGKLFFFAGEEWKRFRGSAAGLQTATEAQTFPTAMEAAGNFSDIYNGGTGLVLKTPAVIPASCGGTVFISPNVINPSCITGDGAAIASLYTGAAKLSTLGALPTATTANNLTFNLPNPANIREDIIRVDEHFNDKQSIYFRYLHDNVLITNPYSTFGATPEVPIDPDQRDRPGYNIQIGWTYVISSTLLNELKANGDWHKQHTPLLGAAWMKTTYGFQFIPPLGNPTQFSDGLPQINFTAVSGFPTAAPTVVQGPALNFLKSPTADISVADNFSIVKNNHAIKFGGFFARNYKTQNSRTTYDGALTFDSKAGLTSGSNSTGDPFADALLGNFSSLSQTSAYDVGYFRFNDIEAYIQDTWKATRKLSLVLGVRYTRTTPTYAIGNNITNFNPFAFNPALDATFTTFGSGSTISTSSPGLCSGPQLDVVGNPVQFVECNGLQRPGQVPSSQARSVPVTSVNPELLSAISSAASRGFYNPENLFSPRIGFSFAPINDKMVIRGGFGIFYDHPQGNVLGNGINSQGYVPWSQSATISGVNSSLSSFDSAPGAGTVPAPSTLSLSGVDPRLVVARSYQYSLGVQQQLPQNMLMQLSYVGNLGRHILRGGNGASNINEPSWTSQGFVPVSPNPNTYGCPAGINAAAYGCAGGFASPKLGKDQLRPYLGYSNLGMELGDVNSNYNSLQATLTKRAGFVTAQLAYTYSKAMGDGGGAGDAYNENPEPECPFTCLVSTASNPVIVTGGNANGIGGTQSGGVVESWQKYDYAKLSFDARQILAASFTLESPWGKSLRGIEGALVKGWSLSSIVHYQSGFSFTATDTVAVGASATGITINRRANFVPGQPVRFSGPCSNAHAICWVNPNAFGPESPLGAGDAPVTNIIGPSFYQWDLSLRKLFSLHYREGMALQFQADAFNAFNQTNWSALNGFSVNNVGSSSFGQLTQSLPARVLQFGGKFTF
jgi:Carboxypeptidase regulatory-like domain